MTKITLQVPVKRGEVLMSEIELVKPNAGELRGLKLTSILQMDVGAMITLLPRITSPSLAPDEVAKLDLPDFMALSSEVVGFFMTAAARAQLQTDTAQL